MTQRPSRFEVVMFTTMLRNLFAPQCLCSHTFTCVAPLQRKRAVKTKRSVLSLPQISYWVNKAKARSASIVKDPNFMQVLTQITTRRLARVCLPVILATKRCLRNNRKVVGRISCIVSCLYWHESCLDRTSKPTVLSTDRLEHLPTFVICLLCTPRRDGEYSRHTCDSREL